MSKIPERYKIHTVDDIPGKHLPGHNCSAAYRKQFQNDTYKAHSQPEPQLHNNQNHFHGLRSAFQSACPHDRAQPDLHCLLPYENEVLHIPLPSAPLESDNLTYRQRTMLSFSKLAASARCNSLHC